MAENVETSDAFYTQYPFPNHPSHIVGARNFAKRFLKHWNTPCKNLLVLGCGTGEEVKGLSEGLPKIASICAVEPCEASYSIAKDLLVSDPCSNVHQ